MVLVSVALGCNVHPQGNRRELGIGNSEFSKELTLDCGTVSGISVRELSGFGKMIKGEILEEEKGSVKAGAVISAANANDKHVDNAASKEDSKDDTGLSVSGKVSSPGVNASGRVDTRDTVKDKTDRGGTDRAGASSAGASRRRRF